MLQQNFASFFWSPGDTPGGGKSVQSIPHTTPVRQEALLRGAIDTLTDDP